MTGRITRGAVIALACAAGLHAQPVTPPAPVPVQQLAPRAGDVIRLRVWREPDMSGDYPVNESGEVTLPRVAAFRVTGISADSLRRFLVATYTPYLRDASVDVFVLRRVRVVGAVRNPGLYPVDATMQVGDVIALAGGATPEGDRRTAVLVRGGIAQRLPIAQDARFADSPVQSGDQIEVPERSWVSRNTALLATLGSTAGLLIVTLVRR